MGECILFRSQVCLGVLSTEDAGACVRILKLNTALYTHPHGGRPGGGAGYAARWRGCAAAQGELINMRPTADGRSEPVRRRTSATAAKWRTPTRTTKPPLPLNEALFEAVQEELYARVRAHGLLERNKL